MEDDAFFLNFTLISVGMIGLRIGIKIYLKRTGIGDLKRILGLGVFWLKFAGNALLLIGVFCLLAVLVTFYFYLQS